MVLGVVQARLGSSRLPRKVLRPLLGEPMISRIIERMRSSGYIDGIAIATTRDASDDDLEEYAKSKGIGFYRGEELDIAGRLYETARKFDAEALVRVWGDCPLVDPEVIDKVIEAFNAEDADYATNVHPPTYPRGLDLEVYKTSTLEMLINDTDDPFYREYPREYVISKPEVFHVANVSNEEDLSDIHWTVDYLEDFNFVEKVYEELYREGDVFHMRDVLELIGRSPEISGLMESNKRLRRNIEYFEALEQRKDQA